MSGMAYSRLTSVTFRAEGLWPLLKSLSPRRSQILLHQGISLLKFNGSDSWVSELAINFSALLKRIMSHNCTGQISNPYCSLPMFQYVYSSNYNYWTLDFDTVQTLFPVGCSIYCLDHDYIYPHQAKLGATHSMTLSGTTNSFFGKLCDTPALHSI